MNVMGKEACMACSCGTLILSVHSGHILLRSWFQYLFFRCTADSEELAASPPERSWGNSFDGAEGQAMLAALQDDSAAPATVISSDGQALLNATSPDASSQPTLIAACEEHERESQEIACKLQNKLRGQPKFQVLHPL